MGTARAAGRALLEAGRAIATIATLSIATVSAAIFLTTPGRCTPGDKFTAADALVLCQRAVASQFKYPSEADVPGVPDHGRAGEHYFAWGAGTKPATGLNDLGQRIPATASCIVHKTTRRITALTFNSQTVI